MPTLPASPTLILAKAILEIQREREREMEIAQVLHMNKGDGETSYAKNSTVQSTIISVTNPAIEKAIMRILCDNSIPESIGVADLGCSSGPNSLLVTGDVIALIHAKCQNLGRPSSPEIRAFLNDLPGNDFNSIFESLPAFSKKLEEEQGIGAGDFCLSCVAGSFYGRLFPKKSLQFVHSSSSLHWLSKVPAGLEVDASSPVNKGKIYISKSSPKSVIKAYSLQFVEDFTLFLKSRADEVVARGRMVLSFVGRSSVEATTDENCYQWELLARALMSMVSEGLIEQSKVDSFNAPFYAPCPEEIKMVMEREGSFTLDTIEAFGIDWDAGVEGIDPVTGAVLSRGQRVANTIRAVVESMLAYHFGQDIMDDLFQKYADIVEDYLSKHGTKLINLVISSTKKG